MADWGAINWFSSLTCEQEKNNINFYIQLYNRNSLIFKKNGSNMIMYLSYNSSVLKVA
jgi:hypothetical protein